MTRIIILAICFACIGCMKTEVIGYEPPEQAVDTLSTKAHRPPPKSSRDTTERQDTARVPIEFDASVHDWNKTNVDL